MSASRFRTAMLRVIVGAAAAAAGLAGPGGLVRAQEPGGLELVDPKVLRVCSDPSNMPFSNQQGEGFENKLAEMFAGKLDKKLAYTWYPQSTGFVRQTLGSFRCDVIMGYPQGDDLVQSTNPYYRSTYVLVVRPGSELDGVDSLGDPRLQGRRIGVVAGTPPATYMVAHDLMAKAKPYSLVVDTRVESSGRSMANDIASQDIDAGVLWGPIAGYWAARTNPALRVVPLVKEHGGPRLAYEITMGVRPADQTWKRELNRLIAENQADIRKLLLGFGVPMLDDKNVPITGQVSAAPAHAPP